MAKKPKDEKIVVHVNPNMAHLVPNFLGNRRDDLRKLTDALKNKDFETIRVLGHIMWNSGSGYGFDAVSEIGESLEKAVINYEDEESIRKAIEKLSTYLERVEVVYD